MTDLDWTSLEADQRNVADGLARRRVFSFLILFLLVSAFKDSMDDAALLAKLIDYADIVLLLVGLAVIAIGWRRRTASHLRRERLLLTGLTIVLAVLLALNFKYGHAAFVALIGLNALV